MILEAKNVEYAYKSQKNRKILNDISVRFEEKKFYTIVGASGAGKTTLLSLLAGLDRPTKGAVLYEGEDILTKGLDNHRKNHVSLVFQEYNLIDYLTAEENVKLGGTNKPEELLHEAVWRAAAAGSDCKGAGKQRKGFIGGRAYRESG